MSEPKLIGLSLSFCVNDIIHDLVALDDVAFIEARTRAVTRDDWEKVFARYCVTYWRDNPERGENVARWLRDDGRIIQPRVEREGYEEVKYAIGIGSQPAVYRGMLLGTHWAPYLQKVRS